MSAGGRASAYERVKVEGFGQIGECLFTKGLVAAPEELGKSSGMEAPSTPTMEFRAMDDSTTFEIFDGGSAIENRKRRRSSLRRVSFAEQPLIHVFARDDDYETPPEGTISGLSSQSTPSSFSRSPQRRSERLFAAGVRRQDDNEVDKENIRTSVGKNDRQKRRGRRPLGLRDTQGAEDDEFLKPSNWLDDRENSTLGSSDENTGPVDLHHIRICDQTMAVEDDDNMTMDSQTFHTRMSQMIANQPLHRVSEVRETSTNFTDMVADVSVLWPEKKAQELERKLLDQPTWHKGDGDISDMSEGSIEVLLRALAKKKSSREESSLPDTEEKTMECWDNWTEGNAPSQGRTASEQIETPACRFDVDDAVSMETSSSISNSDRHKLFLDEGQQADSKNLCDADGLHDSQLQGSRASKDSELHARMLVIASETSDNGDVASMEMASQSLAGGREAAAETDSGTVKRLPNRDVPTPTTLTGSPSTEPLCTALESQVLGVVEPKIALVDDEICSDPLVQSVLEDSPVPLKHYERSRERISTSAAEKDNSRDIQPKIDSNIPFPTSQLHPPSMAVEPVAGRLVAVDCRGLERQESFLQQRVLNKETRKSIGLRSLDGSVHPSIELGKLVPAFDEDTDSMDITRTWTEYAPQLTSIPTKLSDSAKSFLWEDRDPRMDLSDGDMTERYQEGITEAIPKLTVVLGGYNCGSPSVEPLNRIFQRKSEIDAKKSAVNEVTDGTGMQREETFQKGDDTARLRVPEETESISNRGLDDGNSEIQAEPKVDILEANLRNRSAQQSLDQEGLDEDATADFTDQHNWRAEVSSDMSTTPLSPRRSKHFQRLVLKTQTIPSQIDTVSTDSPSSQDDMSAATPNVQDLLAADAEAPESGLGGIFERLFGVHSSSIFMPWQALRNFIVGGEVFPHQTAVGQMEEEAALSMTDKLCTPRVSEKKKHIFECLSEEAAMTLNEMSHSKEVQNSVARKMLLRMMSLHDNGCAQEEASAATETGQSLRRTLHFQPESGSQLQSRPLSGDAGQQISATDFDGTMEVERLKTVDEEMEPFSIESKVGPLQEEARRQKLLQEIQIAEDRLAAPERRFEELRKRAEDCKRAIRKKFWSDIRFEIQEMAASGSYSKLKKRFQLLNCLQSWDVKTTKSGDEVLHKFDYWELFTHSLCERTDNNLEFTVSKSWIDLNEASINQVYRRMNASLAWRWLLSEREEKVPRQSLFHHVQGVHSKVIRILDLMEEVDHCRQYLVIPHFRLQNGSVLHLNLQFSDSELLLDFALSFDMEVITNMSHDQDNATEMNRKLDCTVHIESAGWSFGTKITEADIKRSVTSVVPGHQLLLRVCASVKTLISSFNSEPSNR